MSKKIEKTFEFQESLPRLPVPTVDNTLNKFLQSIIPFYPESRLQEIRQKAKSFVEDGTAEKLQKLLQERSSKEKYHWLQRWWDSYSYYSYRESVVINVSFTFSINHYRKSLLLPLGETPQLNRAVSILYLFSQFEYGLWKKDIPNESFNGQKQCMGSFTRMFRASRIPQEKEDKSIVFQNPMVDTKPDVGFVVVIYKNNFYRLDVYDENGNFASISSLKNQLHQIMESAHTGQDQPLLGLLTSDHRDNWFKAYQILNRDQVNRDSLNLIHRSLFALVLDDLEPHTDDELANFNLHGGGSKLSTSNRYFDKNIQLVIYKNGKVGLIGEHSSFDGAPTVYMTDMVLSEEIKNEKLSRDIIESRLSSEPQKWSRLEWRTSPELLPCVELAQRNIEKAISNLNLHVLHYTAFGKNKIKTVKVSPDAFTQMAMQLAYFRAHNRICPTYESCSTRRFYFGRTETMRTVSTTSVDFVNSMVSNDNKQKKLSYLLKALSNHQKLAKEATEGNGCDRHLLGLRFIAKENGVQHPFLDEPSIGETSTWRLSTSQITVKHFWVGFGPVVEDGYGICYGIFDDSLRFSIASFNSCTFTDPQVMDQHLRSAITDMMELLESASSTKSNL